MVLDFRTRSIYLTRTYICSMYTMLMCGYAIWMRYLPRV